MTTVRLHIYPDTQQLSEALAAAIAIRAEQCFLLRGRYTIVLTGGDTPRELYARLAEIDTEWARWHVYFGDERCVPVGHAERIDAMAREAWLGRVAIPSENIVSIPGELGPERAAEAYRRALSGAGRFDTTLLGLGADGHAASVFPGRPEGLEPDAPDAIPVRDSPKPPPERVSLSARRLRDADEVIFLVSGEAKRDAVARLAALDPSIPATSFVPDGGADLWVDGEASAGIGSAE
jgi:6-phosphogluconolactonase